MGFLERTVDILERISGDDLVDREFALLVQADKLGDKRLRDRIALAGAHDGTHIHQHVGTHIELVDNSARSKRQYSSVELRGMDSGLYHRVVAGSVDSVVSAAVSGDLSYCGGDVSDFLAVDGVGSAKLLSELKALGIAADSDYLVAVRDLRRHDRTHSDCAAAENGDGGVHCRAQRIEYGAGAGLDTAAHRSDEREVNVGVNLYGALLIDNGMRCERGLSEGHGNRLSVLEQLGLAVAGNSAEVYLIEVVALIGVTGHTVVAVVAERIGESYMVAGLDVPDVLADFLNDACALVSENQRQRNGHSLCASEFVSVADSACNDSYQKLVCAWLHKVYILHHERTVLFMYYCCFDLHFTFSFTMEILGVAIIFL